MTTTGAFHSRREDVIWKRMGEESVLLDTRSEKYYTLDEVGTRVWELIDGQSTAHDIASLIAQEYDVSVETAETDIETLLGELANEGLLS